jgi:DNA-binding MarR family transcriptional regulator
MASKKSQSSARLPLAAADLKHEERAAQALRQFRQIFNAVKTHFQQMERTAGLGGSQVWALSAIRDHDEVTVGRLSELMDIRQSTASNLVKLLVERGYVETQRGPSDRRIVCLYLTRAGMAVLKKVPKPFAGVLPDALMRLDDKTLARLNADLSKVLAQLPGVEPKAAKTPLADI